MAGEDAEPKPRRARRYVHTRAHSITRARCRVCGELIYHMRTRTGQSVWLASRYAPHPEHICRTLGRGLGKAGEDHPDLFGPAGGGEKK